MNRAAFLAVLVSAAIAASATTAAPQLRRSPACESQATSFDSHALKCSIPAGVSHRYRLEVNFSGGHDDTMASMTARLDGVALHCDDGSKMRLMGEDGDVSLVCIFSTRAGSDEDHVFEASISFSHAQYVGYALAP